MPISKSRRPNWLDKLRKVNGLTSDDDGHSLDYFLSIQQQQQQQVHDVDDDLHPVSRRASQPEPEPQDENDVSTGMANMLSNLFSDGGCGDRISNFKAPRKQPSPKMCVFSASVEEKGSNESDRVVDDDDVFGRKDVNRNRNVKSKRKVRPGMEEVEEEEEKGRRFEDCDLVGFSRTDVCIIDSSSPLWKFDKYLFRKKNVWKARDYRNVRPRNNNSVAIARKKKREAVDDQDDGGIVVRKKSKTFGSRK
ncbi:hypothetical protein QQ045_021603 [Rhodiola kirilowii]